MATAAASASKKRSGGHSVAAVSTKPERRLKSLKSAHVVHWDLKDGKFICPKNGVLAEPLPPLFEKFVKDCNMHLGRRLLPREYVKNQALAGSCFTQGCDQPHMWHQCPTLAKHVYDGTKPVRKE